MQYRCIFAWWRARFSSSFPSEPLPFEPLSAVALPPAETQDHSPLLHSSPLPALVVVVAAAAVPAAETLNCSSLPGVVVVAAVDVTAAVVVVAAALPVAGDPWYYSSPPHPSPLPELCLPLTSSFCTRTSAKGESNEKWLEGAHRHTQARNTMIEF